MSENELIFACKEYGVNVDAESKKHLFPRGFGTFTGYGLCLKQEIVSDSDITTQEKREPGKGARFDRVVPKGMWRMNGKGA